MVKKTAEDRRLERSQKRGEIRKMLTETQSEAQVRISRERGRQRRSVEKVKTQQRVIERQGSESARTQGYAERAKIAEEQRAVNSALRVDTQQELYGLARREKVISGATGAVTGSSIWGTVTLVVSLFFTMIVIYVIVRNGEGFGSLAGSMSTFISTLSSNKPLFVATPSTPDEAE